MAAGAYDVDFFDTSAATIAALRAGGRKVICYFSAGSFEDWRSDAGLFPAAALGNPLDGWPGERWLDTRAAGVRAVMRARMDLAVSKKCDAVDPDNVDGYTNGPGFPLTAATQLDYNKFLAAEAHARGLSVGLKNDLSQVASLVDDFDFAINEQCQVYRECDMLAPFIARSKAVFGIEYNGSSSTVCAAANGANFDTNMKKLDSAPGAKPAGSDLPARVSQGLPSPGPLPQAGEGERSGPLSLWERVRVRGRGGSQMWTTSPSAAAVASYMTSDSVGCGWTAARMSWAVASEVMASDISAIRSVTP